MTERRFLDTSRGIDLGPPAFLLPEGAMRAMLGAHPIGPQLLSRFGSTLLQTIDDVHSLASFDGSRYVGAGTVLFKAGSSIITGLDGNRLAMVPVQVQYATPAFEFGGSPPPIAPSDPDTLFVCGGGASKKIFTNGTVSKWGIDPPASSPPLSVITGGPLTAGVYKVAVSYLNGSTGNWSDPDSFEGSEITCDGVNDIISINTSAIDNPADTQITHFRLWVSQPDGPIMYHKQDTVVTVTSIVITNNTLDLTFPYDPLVAHGVVPNETQDVVGPHVGRLFLSRINVDGERGRLYYTQPLEYEYVASFIDICSDHEFIQKLSLYNRRLFVFTNERIFEVVNTGEPFVPIGINGTHGTTAPYTVAGSPFGIFYLSQDGVRLFDGSSSRIVGRGLERIFRGEFVDKSVQPFEPTTGGWARGEYFLSDSSRTYAYNPERDRWREIGIGVTAFFFEDENNVILIGTASKALLFEEEQVFTDDGKPIPIEWQWPATRAEAGGSIFVQYVSLLINTQGQKLDFRIIMDDIALDLTTVNSGSEPELVEIPVMRPCREFSFRLSGPTTDQVTCGGASLVYSDRGGL